jgi:PRTRC genetic system ThiF family protein
MIHHTHPALLAHTANVHLVGCGGNGSQMLSGLARLDRAVRALGHEGLLVTAWDPDEVSDANVGRQLFSPAEIGMNKAVTLVTRANALFGRAWQAAPTRYDPAMAIMTDIVITCVDTASARAEIGRGAKLSKAYWLDLGNREADGQAVLGEFAKPARAEFRLPHILDLFPALARGKAEEDAAPSCSLAEALERQELFVNQAVATAALQILWQLFRFGQIEWHGTFVNLKSGRTTPLAVDREAWARFGYGAKKQKGKK